MLYITGKETSPSQRCRGYQSHRGGWGSLWAWEECERMDFQCSTILWVKIYCRPFQEDFVSFSGLWIHITSFLVKTWFKIMDPHWSLAVTSTSEIFVWLVSPNVIEVQILLQQYFKGENRVKNLRPRGQIFYHLKEKKGRKLSIYFLKDIQKTTWSYAEICFLEDVCFKNAKKNLNQKKFTSFPSPPFKRK